MPAAPPPTPGVPPPDMVADFVPPPSCDVPVFERPTTNLYLVFPGGGEITWYCESGEWEFQCPNVASHGRCRITRSSHPPGPRVVVTNPGQGRALGLAVAWIFHNKQPYRVLHKNDVPPLHLRSKARQWLLRQPIDSDAYRMLASERPLIAGEIHYNGEPDIIE